MAAPESEYDDAFGLPHERRAQWGAVAEQQRQSAALKGLNPQASQYTNINPNTAPRPSTVQQRASQLQRGVAAQQPTTAPQQAPQQQPIQREFGQPRRGAGATPGQPVGNFDQKVQAPLGGKYSRGYGPNAGLLPEDNQFQRNYYARGGGTQHFFGQLASLPNASREIQWFARQAAEEDNA